MVKMMHGISKLVTSTISSEIFCPKTIVTPYLQWVKRRQLAALAKCPQRLFPYAPEDPDWLPDSGHLFSNISPRSWHSVSGVDS